MPSDQFESRMDLKYNILKEHADAAMLDAKARGGLYGAQAAEQRDVTTRHNTPIAGPGALPGPADPATIPLPDDGSSMSSDGSYAKGTSRVPAGKGKGKGPAPAPAKGAGLGMVPAKIAPGEAVLTPGAAEHLGRDNIGALNAASHFGNLPSQQPGMHGGTPQSIGSIKSLPPPPAPGGGAPGGPQGFSRGTEDVESPSASQNFEDADAFAKGTSSIPATPDAIGQKVTLGNTKGGGKPVPDLALAKGTAKVPGKPTHPSKDTVHAHLPSGGAVLTNDAANHVGRGLIAHLNALHSGMPPVGGAGGPPPMGGAGGGGGLAALMGGGGMPPMGGGGAPPMKPPGFAEGTPMVPPAVTPQTNGQALWAGAQNYGRNAVADIQNSAGGRMVGDMVNAGKSMYNDWSGGSGGALLHPVEARNQVSRALTPQ